MESLLWLVVNLEEALSSSLFSDLSSQKVMLFYFIACSKTLHLKSLIISSMFSHFRLYFCLVCVFFLSNWANSLNSSMSCLSTSQSLIRIIVMHLARSRLSYSKTEQNSNPCEKAKLREVWVSLDPNTPLAISLCSISWTGYGVAPTNGRLSVYKWKADWGQDS